MAPARPTVIALSALGALAVGLSHAQTPDLTPAPDTVLVVPPELAERLPCDEQARSVLGSWVLGQADPVAARAVVDLLSEDEEACAPVREAAINLAVTLDLSGASTAGAAPAPAISAAVPEAFAEAEQEAERLSFSVGPPPRNLTRNAPESRIYQP